MGLLNHNTRLFPLPFERRYTVALSSSFTVMSRVFLVWSTATTRAAPALLRVEVTT